MSHPPGTTGTTTEQVVVPQKTVLDQRCHDRHDRYDLCAQGLSKNQTLVVLVQWMRGEVEATPAPPRVVNPADLFPVVDVSQLDTLLHAAEQEAMRGHYAARAGPELPPCTMKAGLLKGYFDHLHIMKRD